MTSEEIAKTGPIVGYTEIYGITFWLKEIAYQLACMNEANGV